MVTNCRLSVAGPSKGIEYPSLCDTINTGMDNLQTPDLYTEPISAAGQPGKMGYIDVAIMLAQGWRRILVVSAVSMVLGACIAFLVLKSTFTATAVILPPQT